MPITLTIQASSTTDVFVQKYNYRTRKEQIRYNSQNPPRVMTAQPGPEILQSFQNSENSPCYPVTWTGIFTLVHKDGVVQWILVPLQQLDTQCGLMNKIQTRTQDLGLNPHFAMGTHGGKGQNQ